MNDTFSSTPPAASAGAAAASPAARRPLTTGQAGWRERAAMTVLVLLTLLLPYILSEYAVRLLNLALISSIAVMGLVVAFGWAGLIHLGQATFVAIGAYLTSILSFRFGMGYWTALPISLLGGTGFALLLGVPLLRLRGHYFAFATAGLTLTSDIIIRNWVNVTGGNDGLIGMEPIALFGFPIDNDTRFFYFVWAVVGLMAFLLFRLRHSYIGRAIYATRDDELAAGVSTVPVFRVRLMAFAISAFLGAASGTLYAPYSGYIAPQDFSLSHSVLLVVTMVLGGETSAIGAVLGAIIIGYLPEWLRFVGDAYLILFNIGVILVLIFMRSGLAGAAKRLNARIQARR